MQSTRSWCYTINNFTEEDLQGTRALKCAYNIFGYEAGVENTPHLQGYVHFKEKKSLRTVKKVMPRAHLEPRQGTVDQAVDYCKKEGNFEEFGVKPMTQKEKGNENKKRWRLINEKAREGDEAWLEENEPHVYHTGLATFRSHKKAKITPLDYVDTPHEWWCGPTGTGKSKKVWEDYPTHYAKEKNKWWCNYTGQDTVVIEEADPKNMEHLADRLKVWADRYPFPGEIKGGRIEGIRPLKIIVTSNYTPEECFTDSQNLEPILRRFKVVKFGDSAPAVHPNYTIFAHPQYNP